MPICEYVGYTIMQFNPRYDSVFVNMKKEKQQFDFLSSCFNVISRYMHWLVYIYTRNKCCYVLK